MVLKFTDVEIHMFHYEDGTPLVSNTFLYSITDDMVESGFDRLVWYNAPTEFMTHRWFQQVKSLEWPLWIGFHTPSKRPVMVMWLTHLSPRSAYIHFHVMTHFRSHGTHRIGKEILTTILYYKTPDTGHYRFDVIYGLIPIINQPAIRFAQRIGGNILTDIPSACYILDNDESIPGTFFYQERKNGKVPRKVVPFDRPASSAPRRG